MTKDEALSSIEREITTAREAERKGNDGMARVCARRAAGVAITFWLESHPGVRWGMDAMSQLRALQADESFPPEVRSAATRLTTKVTEQFTSPFSTHPVDDARVIVDYFLREH